MSLGISQNYEKYESIRDISRRNGSDSNEEFEQIRWVLFILLNINFKRYK